jgi:hypothetical protein
MWQSIDGNDREKYQAYLASREWASRKEAVKRRSGGTCERCLINPMDHVHHLTYARKYAEPLTDLQALCKPCHDFTHAKSDTDPAAVPLLFRRPIKSVYLAGKMGTAWRDSLMREDIRMRGGWSNELRGIMGHIGTGEPGDYTWRTVDDCVEVPEGRSIDFTGPYWVPALGGHDWAERVAEDAPCTHAAGWNRNAIRLTWECKDAIRKADLIFAWIDSADAYGTLVEIGMAISANPGKVVVVAVDAALGAKVVRDLWFPMAAAAFVMPAGRGAGIVAHSARQAWDWVWGECRGRRADAGAVVVVLDAAGRPAPSGKSWCHKFWHIGNPALPHDAAYLPAEADATEASPHDCA